MTKGLFYFLLIFGIVLCFVGLGLIGWTIYEERKLKDEGIVSGFKDFAAQPRRTAQMIGGGISLALGVVLIVTAVALRPHAEAEAFAISHHSGYVPPPHIPSPTRKR